MVAEPIQSGTIQSRTTIAIVAIDMLLGQVQVTLGDHIRTQAL
jgi:hypothetical protein